MIEVQRRCLDETARALAAKKRLNATVDRVVPESVEKDGCK